MAHSEHSVNVSSWYFCSFSPLRTQPACPRARDSLVKLKGCLLAGSALVPPSSSFLMSKSYSSVRPSSGAWSSRNDFFIVFFFPLHNTWQHCPLALGLAWIHSTAASVLGWAVSGTVSPACLGQLCGEFILLSPNHRHREPSGCAFPI